MNDERTKRGAERRAADRLYKAALGDPDNPPLTPKELERLSRNIPNTRYIRRQLKLSIEEFASAFGFPVGIVRDWEKGKRVPDQAAQSLLRIIAQDPQVVLSLAEKAGLAAR
jgi:putative transcriptional regulator